MKHSDLKTIRKQLDLVSYQDCRDFLASIYQLVRMQKTSYSYLQYAEDLGFSPTNVIRLMINGKRRLSRKSALTIAKSLGLKRHERQYFLAMVEHAAARGRGARDESFRVMLGAKMAGMASGVERDRLRYYSEWYFPIIREMSRLPGFRPDSEWICRRLGGRLATEKAKAALSVLSGLGLLANEASFSTGIAAGSIPQLLPEMSGESLPMMRYHQAMLDVAKEALSSVPAEEREYNALTLCVSMTSYEKLRQRIRDLCMDMMALDQAPQEREAVVQINIQSFIIGNTK